MKVSILSRIAATICFALLAGCATTPTFQWTVTPLEQFNEPLTLERSIEIALSDSLHESEWAARLQAARAELTKAREIPNPTLDFSWEGIGLHDDQGNGLLESTYAVSYPIFFWWTRGKEVAAARANERAEAEAIRRDQRQLAIEIGAAYFELVAGSRKIKINEQILADTQETLRFMTENQRLGAASGHEVKAAEAEVLKSKGDLYEAQSQHRINQLAFAYALGAGQPTLIQVVDDRPPTAIPVDLKGDSGFVPESFLQKVVQQDPNFARAHAAREAAESHYQAETRRSVPLADAAITAGTKTSIDDPAGVVSLSVPLPLFNWNSGAIERAKAELLSARVEEEKASREIGARLSREWESYRSAERRYSEINAPLTENLQKLAEQSRELFSSGQITYLELLQTRRDWEEAELKSIDSWREREVAAWQLYNEL